MSDSEENAAKTASQTVTSASSRPARAAKARGNVIIDEARCKGCELCIHVCPEGALELSPALNQFSYHPVRFKEDGNCTGCALCAQVCPDVGIEVHRE